MVLDFRRRFIAQNARLARSSPPGGVGSAVAEAEASCRFRRLPRDTAGKFFPRDTAGKFFRRGLVVQSAALASIGAARAPRAGATN